MSRGLLKLVQNEAQLAGILGHEIAHVSKKHALETIRRSKALAGISEVTLTALDKDPQMFDSVVKEVVNMIFENGLGRTKELEADKIGVEFAYRVGYNPNALKSFIELLKPHMSGSRQFSLSKTHPDPKDRAQNLQNVLSQSNYKGSQSLPLLADRLVTSLSNIKL